MPGALSEGSGDGRMIVRGERTMADKRLAHGRRLFEYHCYEGEDSADAELWHHTHQSVEVLAKLEGGGYEIRMYRVHFVDGLEWDVFDDELVSSSAQYERADYTRLQVPSPSACGR